MNIAERRCLEQAGRQRGLIARRQARAVGMADRTIIRRLADGAWQRVVPEVFLIGPGPVESQLLARATTLWIAGSAVSHRTAARAWKLDLVSGDEVDVMVPIRARHPGVVFHRSSARLDGQTRLVDGVPTTDPARTLLDVSRWNREARLELALEDALRRGLVTERDFVDRFLGWTRQGRRGAARWRRVLTIRSRAVRDSDTPFERALALALRRGGLPTPEPQFEVRSGAGLVARVDFAYPSRKVAIEAQSVTWHLGREAWERDLRRQTSLATLGWVILYFTYRQVAREPEIVVSQVRAALERAD